MASTGAAVLVEEVWWGDLYGDLDGDL